MFAAGLGALFALRRCDGREVDVEHPSSHRGDSIRASDG
jgi:hypothetical protein